MRDLQARDVVSETNPATGVRDVLYPVENITRGLAAAIGEVPATTR